MVTFFSDQYELVRQSRSVLLDFCDTLSSDDFVEENSSFGRGGSVRNLLVHCANTYEFWIVTHALQKQIEFTPYTSITTIYEMRLLFQKVDKEMTTFFYKFETIVFNELEIHTGGELKLISPLELFTHVITHEFHHKGQILSLCRHLGHIPIDTDIIR